MGRRQLSRILCIGTLVGLGGCGPDEDVELLALPPLERPTPEARLGIPEVAGVWRFAGWEIIEGDSTSLERTFPSFGELRFQTQRLDSIAGSFVLGGAPVPVIGDVRRDGRLTFVTLAGGSPQNFVAGTYQQDTLWLELSSILPADEWPQDARAAFVRDAPSEPAFAWLRGARIAEPPPPAPVDSLMTGVPGAAGGAPSVGASAGAPVTGGVASPDAGRGQPRQTQQQPPVRTPGPAGQQPGAQPRTPAQQAPVQPTQPVQQPPAGQPARPPANQPVSQPPAQQPPAQQSPTPQQGNPPAGPPAGPAQPPVDQPAPGPAQPPPSEPPAEDPGPLLGEPINP